MTELSAGGHEIAKAVEVSGDLGITITATSPDGSKQSEIRCQELAAAAKQVRSLLQRGYRVAACDHNGNRLEGAALAAAVFSSTATPTERLLNRFYFKWIEPLAFARKKAARAALFEIGSLAGLPRAAIDLGLPGPACIPSCGEIVEAHRRYLGKYIFAETPPGSWKTRGVPLVIDLDQYQNFEAYMRRLKRHSKGAAVRQAAKASRQGFYCRRIDRRYHAGELSAIETSTRVRSGGLVVAAFLRRPAKHQPPAAQTPTAPEPACDRHWYVDWGVFHRPEPGVAAGPDRPAERLAGYIYLKRVGTTIRVTSLLGHRDDLPHGIMKLLFLDVMKWLLDRQTPIVQGVRYLHYGAIEHGRKGLPIWKRRLQFEPSILAWASSSGMSRSLRPEADRSPE